MVENQWLLACEVTLKMAVGDISWWVIMWKTRDRTSMLKLCCYMVICL